MKILFIGNSYTFTHNLPRMVKKLIAPVTRNDRVGVCMLARPSYTLREHWENTDASARIRVGGWDKVIIQELSTGPLHNQNDFERYAKCFVAAAQSVKAEPILFQTWARRAGHANYQASWSGGDPSSMQALLRQRYTNVARESGARVAFAGDAWQRSLAKYPEIVLHQDDGEHPLLTGSFLASLVIAEAIVGTEIHRSRYKPLLLWSDSVANKLRAVAFNPCNRQVHHDEGYESREAVYD